MSTAAIAGELREIQRLTQQRKPSRRGLEAAVRAFTHLARELPVAWDELPEDLRRMLVDLAYGIAEPPEPPFLQGFLGKAYAVWLILTGHMREIATLYEAGMEFADVVLALSEHGNDELQEALGERLRELTEQKREDLLSYEAFADRVLGR
jgi:hypothetical protein